MADSQVIVDIQFRTAGLDDTQSEVDALRQALQQVNDLAQQSSLPDFLQQVADNSASVQAALGNLDTSGLSAVDSGASDAASSLTYTSSSADDASSSLANIASSDASGALDTLAQSSSDVAQNLGDLNERTDENRDHTDEASGAWTEGASALGELRSQVVEVGGDAIPGLNTALEQGSNLIHGFSAEAETGSEKLALIGTGVAGVGVAIAGMSFAAFDQGVEKLHQLALQTGMAEPEVQGLMTSFEAAGVSSDKTGALLARMSLNVQKLSQDIADGKQPSGNFVKALDEIGVSAFGADGQMLPMSQLLPAIFDGFKKSSEEASASGKSFNAAGVAMELMGKQGAGAVPALLEGSEGLSKYTEEAKRLGIGSAEQVAHLEAFKKSTAEAGLEAKGLAFSLGSDVAPAMTAAAGAAAALFEKISELPTPVRDLAVGLPIMAGGALAGVAALGQVGSLLGGVAGSARETAVALGILSVAEESEGVAADIAMGPLAPLALGITALTAGIALAVIHADSAGDSFRRFADAEKKATDDAQKYVEALKQQNATEEQVRSVSSQKYAESIANMNAADAAVQQYVAAKTAEANGHAVNTEKLSKEDQTMKDLITRQNEARATAAGWTQVTHDQEQAAQQAASANAALAASQKEISVSVVHDTELMEDLTKATTKAGQSAADSATFHQQLAMALEHGQVSAAGQKAEDEQLQAAIDGAKGSTAQAAETQLRFNQAVEAFGPAAVQAAVAHQQFIDKYPAAKSGADDAAQGVKDITTALDGMVISANEAGDALLASLSKPSSEELAEKARVADLTSQIADQHAVLADLGPSGQAVAAAQARIDKDTAEHASKQQMAQDYEALNAALKNVSQADADAATAAQKQIDALQGQLDKEKAHTDALRAKREAMAASTEATIDNATKLDDDKAATDKIIQAVKDHKAGLDTQKPALDTSTQATKDNTTAVQDAVPAYQDLQTKGTTAIQTLQTNVNTALNDLDKTVPAAATKIGTDIDAGLVAGLAAGAPGVFAEADGIATGIETRIRTALDTHSPSWVMYQIGQDVDAGLQEGMSSKRAEVLAEAHGIAHGVATSFDEVYQAGSGWQIQDKIAPDWQVQGKAAPDWQMYNHGGAAATPIASAPAGPTYTNAQFIDANFNGAGGGPGGAASTGGKAAPDFDTVLQKGAADFGEVYHKETLDFGEVLQKGSLDFGQVLVKEAPQAGATVGDAIKETLKQLDPSLAEAVKLTGPAWGVALNEGFSAAGPIFGNVAQIIADDFTVYAVDHSAAIGHEAAGGFTDLLTKGGLGADVGQTIARAFNATASVAAPGGGGGGGGGSQTLQADPFYTNAAGPNTLFTYDPSLLRAIREGHAPGPNPYTVVVNIGDQTVARVVANGISGGQATRTQFPTAA